MAGPGDRGGVLAVDDKIYVDIPVSGVAKVGNERIVFFADLFNLCYEFRNLRAWNNYILVDLERAIFH